MSVQCPTREEALEHFNNFLACLTDKSVYYLTSLPKEALSSEQQSALRCISEHLLDGDSGTARETKSITPDDLPLAAESGEDHFSGPSTPSSTPSNTIRGSKRPVGRPPAWEGSTASSPHNSAWGPIIMIEDISLHNTVSNCLETLDTSDMSCIFNGPLSLPCPSAQHVSDEADLFEGLCSQVSQMSKGTAMDRVRWLFMVLTLGNMTSALMRARFGGSTTQVPRSAAVQQFLGAEASNSLRTMVDMAMNLKFICHTFGVGCLFFLESVLNEDFLGRHLTRQGKQFRDMLAHLQNLGLGQAIEVSGANDIGNAIEFHLALAYDIDGAGEE